MIALSSCRPAAHPSYKIQTSYNQNNSTVFRSIRHPPNPHKIAMFPSKPTLSPAPCSEGSSTAAVVSAPAPAVVPAVAAHPSYREAPTPDPVSPSAVPVSPTSAPTGVSSTPAPAVAAHPSYREAPTPAPVSPSAAPVSPTATAVSPVSPPPPVSPTSTPTSTPTTTPTTTPASTPAPSSEEVYWRRAKNIIATLSLYCDDRDRLGFEEAILAGCRLVSVHDALLRQSELCKEKGAAQKAVCAAAFQIWKQRHPGEMPNMSRLAHFLAALFGWSEDTTYKTMSKPITFNSFNRDDVALLNGIFTEFCVPLQITPSGTY